MPGEHSQRQTNLRRGRCHGRVLKKTTQESRLRTGRSGKNRYGQLECSVNKHNLAGNKSKWIGVCAEGLMREEMGEGEENELIAWHGGEAGSELLVIWHKTTKRDESKR